METYNFIKEHKFSELHVFPYSKRTGTPAARMEDQVDENVKNERVHRLIALSDQLAKNTLLSMKMKCLRLSLRKRLRKQKKKICLSVTQTII